jgi:hypothetical protein
MTILPAALSCSRGRNQLGDKALGAGDRAWHDASDAKRLVRAIPTLVLTEVINSNLNRSL